MKRFALLTASFCAACNAGTNGSSDPETSGEIRTAIEASAVPEVADIPTEDAALQQAREEVTEDNADAVFDELMAEIEAELADQP